MVTSDLDEFQCTYHPNVRTRLRCSKCGTPICPRCAVETPVGYRCPACANVRGLPTYRMTAPALIKSILIGLIVAAAVGVLWGYFPAWSFYLALALGFGVAEGMAWAANQKRGAELQLIGIACVVGGIILARVILAGRTGHALDDLRNNPDAFSLADLIFAAIAIAIPYIRFR